MRQKNLYLFLQIGGCWGRAGIPHFFRKVKDSNEKIRVLENNPAFISTTKLNLELKSGRLSPSPPKEDVCLETVRDSFLQQLHFNLASDKFNDKYFAYIDLDYRFSKKDFEYLFSRLQEMSFIKINFFILGYNIIDSLKFNYLQTLSAPSVTSSSRLYTIKDFFIDYFLKKLECAKLLLTSDFLSQRDFHFIDLDLLDATGASFGSCICKALSLDSSSIEGFNFPKRTCDSIPQFVDPFFVENVKNNLDKLKKDDFKSDVDLLQLRNINVDSRWMGHYLDLDRLSRDYIKDFLELLTSRLGIEFFKKTCFYEDSSPITFFEI